METVNDTAVLNALAEYLEEAQNTLEYARDTQVIALLGSLSLRLDAILREGLALTEQEIARRGG